MYIYQTRIHIKASSVGDELNEWAKKGWRLHICTWCPQGFILVFEKFDGTKFDKWLEAVNAEPIDGDLK